MLNYRSGLIAFVILAIGVGLGLSGGISPSHPAHAARAQAASNLNNQVFLPLVLSPTAPVAVSIQNFAYNPQTITVTVGTQVTWTNQESFSIFHTVTSGVPFAPDGKFDSGLPYLSPGMSFAFTFTSTGTYPYYCKVHLTAMTGTVIVVP